jgi:hypothetical protein
MKTNFITQINSFKSVKTPNKIFLNFFFLSLISPFIVNNLRFSFFIPLKEKKTFLKQSYILLTWFYYLTFVQQKFNTKNKLNFFVAPSSKKKFTLTKAPMAHKNWSKEQYKFQYFNFRISFNIFFKEDNKVDSLNKTLLFILLTKKTFPQFETNLLFLKNINFYLKFYDTRYFNYSFFKLN